MWFGHRAIKQQFCMWAVFRDTDGALVVSFANPGQSTRTAALLGSFGLAILLDGNTLQIPLLVKRTRDGPVVRHAYRLPRLFVVRKTPVVTQNNLLSLLCQHR